MRKIVLALATVALGGVVAQAGLTGVKYVQSPDPWGWDVYWGDNSIDPSSKMLGDDFPCFEAGPILDLHFWVSWQGDSVGEITGINASFWSNQPATSTDPSQPLTKLWEGTYGQEDFFVVQPPAGGDQGWFDPWGIDPTTIPNDHDSYYRVDIPDLIGTWVDPQAEGYFYQNGSETDPQVYWLVLDVAWSGDETLLGWKTSGDRFGDPLIDDDAVYGYAQAPSWDPVVIGNESRNLAFALTIPEPASLLIWSLLGLVAVVGTCRLRRKA